VIVGRVEPGSYLLVADMDGVKMVSVDGSDEKSLYVAAVGRPFLSNLVALAYDSTSKIAYYSDVARYLFIQIYDDDMMMMMTYTFYRRRLSSSCSLFTHSLTLSFAFTLLLN